MKVSIHKTDGKSSGKKIELSDEIFAIEPNETVLYEDVRRFLSNSRQGTAKTKERGEVRGGGRKAYRQKGTGMARRGSIRSPLLRGGGTVFGPKPRTYSVKMTRKMRQLARRSALSLKAAESAVTVVEDFTWDAPKTRQMVDLLQAFELAGKKVLLLTAKSDEAVYKSARNIQGVNVMEAGKPNSYQILNADVLLIQKSGVDVLESSFTTKKAEETE